MGNASLEYWFGAARTELAAAVNAACPCDGSNESNAAPRCSSSRSCPTRPKRAAHNSSTCAPRARFDPIAPSATCVE